MSRIAIIYDDTERPETTGGYCLRTLREVASVQHFLPQALAHVPRHGFDLYLFIDDGSTYEVPPDLQPQAWWAIDTHLNCQRLIEATRHAEVVFCAQRDGMQRLGNGTGIQTVWLPLACDPVLHAPIAVEKTVDVCFVGNFVGHERLALLDVLRGHFQSLDIGQCYFHDMALAYSRARTAFNRSVGNDINMRVFEAMACGALLVTNDLSEQGQGELFTEGIHLATYRSADELVDKLKYYLRHEDVRTRVAAAGRQEVLARHTYRHRLTTILDTMLSRSHATPTKVAVPVNRPIVDRTYFDFARAELVAEVPLTARKILDIGCGSGQTGALLKTRQSCEVWGVEIDPSAATEAQQRLDQVFADSIEDDTISFPDSSFDAVLCGDVLEHLTDPERVLRRIRGWLKPDGVLVASIPNVRHHSVVRSLVAGNWTYELAGLLDRTHLRFFTRREIEKLLFRSGFIWDNIRSRQLGSDQDQLAQILEAGSVTWGSLSLRDLSPADWAEFHAYQYIVAARRGPERPWENDVTTIILITHNSEPCIRTCIDQLCLHTTEPYELIVVDCGSTDDTLRYLARFSNIEILRSAARRRYDEALDVGLPRAKAASCVVMQPQCVVTTGWLTRLLLAAAGDTNVGMVGPVSNRGAGCQSAGQPEMSFAELDGFAWDRSQLCLGETVDVDHLQDFCYLLTSAARECLLASAADANLQHLPRSQQLRQAGFSQRVAKDCFVHQLPKLSLRGELEPPGDSNDGQHVGHPELARSFATKSLSPQDPVPECPLNLSLCMIVRDNAAILEECLSSIRPWVDEMVVVDTGSRDATVDIAHRLGARVFHFPWCDDFAAARNESLRHARGKWLFWMDSDDVIDDINGHKLRELARGPHPEHIMGYVAQVHCPGQYHAWEPDVTIVDHVKLIRNRSELRFEGRIHEQILPAIRRQQGDVLRTDIYVTHAHGSRTLAQRQQKHERDLALLLKEAETCPDHPFTLFNLGMTYADMGQHEQAIDALSRSILVADPQESQVRKAYALLSSSWCALQRYECSLRALEKGLAVYPRDAELHFRRGVVLQYLHRVPEAIAAYHATLESHDEPHFMSLDRGISSYKCRHNLALAYREQEAWEQAKHQWEAAVAEEPKFRAAWRGLVELALKQGQVERAEEIGERLRELPGCEPEAWCVQCDILAHHGHDALAKKQLEAAHAQFPQDLEILQRYCRYLFETEQWTRAEHALQQLCDCQPDDAAAHHNLATVYFQLGRHELAAISARRALTILPSRSQSAELLRLITECSTVA